MKKVNFVILEFSYAEIQQLLEEDNDSDIGGDILDVAGDVDIIIPGFRLGD